MGGALEARQVAATSEWLQSEATGEIEREGKILVLKRIHLRYTLKVADEKREAALRAHEHHVDACPVARSLKGAIQITTEMGFEPT